MVNRNGCSFPTEVKGTASMSILASLGKNMLNKKDTGLKKRFKFYV